MKFLKIVSRCLIGLIVFLMFWLGFCWLGVQWLGPENDGIILIGVMGMFIGVQAGMTIATNSWDMWTTQTKNTHKK